jgi:hypothetical protein
VNLSNVSRLHVFSLYVIIRCDAPQFSVLDDLNIVLSTIPESNKFTNLALDFNIIRVGLGECLHHDWDGMYKEVIRISDGKPLEVEIQMSLGHGNSEEKDELYTCIMDEAGLLSDYPNICTHFWNPTFWAHGLLPFPRGQVRSRCRR